MFNFLDFENICTKPCNESKIDLGQCFCHHIQYQKQGIESKLSFIHVKTATGKKKVDITGINLNYPPSYYKKYFYPKKINSSPHRGRE